MRKVTKALRREGVTVGRDQVGRLMAALGIQGLVRGTHGGGIGFRGPLRLPPHQAGDAESGHEPADLVPADGDALRRSALVTLRTP